jgi:hypothetical protein
MEGFCNKFSRFVKKQEMQSGSITISITGILGKEIRNNRGFLYACRIR